MKVKLSLDKATIKDFFLQHSEKIVLGLFGACFVLVVYSAWGRESFDRTSEQLQQDAQRAQTNIQNTAADAANLDEETFKAPELVESKPVKVKLYQWALAWDRPLFTTGTKRGESQIFPVEALRATAGVGAFNIVSAQGRAGKRWVVVTGLVPIEKQQMAIVEAFATAEHRNPEADTTNYLGYYVQRAEVTDSTGNGNLKWSKRFNSKSATKAAEKMFGQSGRDQLVDAKFIIETVGFPLPPLLSGEWDASVAHEPEILANQKEEDSRINRNKPEPDEEPATNDDDPFGEGGTTEPTEPTAQPDEDKDAEPQYALFRFFDYDVEPGKRYRYRARLVMKNPNYRVKARYLVDPDLAKANVLRTAWSAPSEMVFVSRDSRSLAVSVKAPARKTAEPEGRMLVVKFDMRRGREVHQEFSVHRGDMLNFVDRGAAPERTGRGSRSDDDDLLRPPREEDDDQGSVNYQTDCLVLDLRGGLRRLGRKKLDAPGEFLILEPGGVLVVHNELADLADCLKLAEGPSSDRPERPERRPPDRVRGEPSGDGNLGDLMNLGKKPAPKRSRRGRSR